MMQCPTTKLSIDRSLQVALLGLGLGTLGALIGYWLSQDILIGFSIAGAITSLFFLVSIAALIGKTRRAYRDMQAGDCYVHWIYPLEDWRDHVDGERSRIKLQLPSFLLLGLLLGSLVALFVIGLTVFTKHQSFASVWRGGLLVISLPVGLCLLIGLIDDALRWLRLRRLASGGEILIGSQGLFYCGEYWPSRSPSPHFLDVKFHPGSEAYLQFQFEKTVKNGIKAKEEIRVPVLPAHVQTISALLGRIKKDW